MAIQTIDNPSVSNRPRRKWVVRAIVAMVIVGAGVLTVPWMDVRATSSRMDAITGSMEWQTVWLFGITSGPSVNVSPLEARLTRMNVSWKPDWRGLHNTHRTILGNATCFECGLAPPIYQIQSVLKEFAAGATDAEIRDFVRVMQSGDNAQKEAAVQAAGAKGLTFLAMEPASSAP